MGRFVGNSVRVWWEASTKPILTVSAIVSVTRKSGSKPQLDKLVLPRKRAEVTPKIWRIR